MAVLYLGMSDLLSKIRCLQNIVKELDPNDTGKAAVTGVGIALKSDRNFSARSSTKHASQKRDSSLLVGDQHPRSQVSQLVNNNFSRADEHLKAASSDGAWYPRQHIAVPLNGGYSVATPYSSGVVYPVGVYSAL